MRQHVKQAALTFALALPLVLTVVFSGPFTMSTAAQPGARMVGPQFPILMDSNGNGPGPGDASTTPQQANSTTMQLPTLFSCNSQANNTVALSGSDTSGRFRTASRTNNARTQTLNVTGVSGGTATQFSLTETLGSITRASGTGTLLDSNGDGNMDAMSIASTKGSFLVSLVFTPDSSYASIPVSQATILGARQGACGPAVSQIWVPLADTNADGRGDSVVLDLDGNGLADPQYYSSPRVGAIGVPTTNSVGLALLTLLLGGIGVWYLGQRRIGDPGPV